MKSTAKALIHVGFENKIVAFKFSNLGHFPTVFVSLKVTCLVTLFDPKTSGYPKRKKWTILRHLKKCKCSSLRWQC